MTRTLLMMAAVLVVASHPLAAAEKVDPVADLKAYQNSVRSKFPNVKFEEFANGPYTMDAGMHKQWEEIMQFPPYDFALDEGKELFEKPFANGKTYGDCFPNKGIGIRQNYPYFDTKRGEVVTLELAINECRQANGEKPLPWQVGAIASISAYMASTSRGKPLDIKIPDDPRALDAYNAGREYYYTRRGQLAFSCASCHTQNPGKRLRGDVLAPALGILASFPLYRSEWGSMGTIDRRFISCNTLVRAEGLPPQDPVYRNLEYFLTYVSNGIPVVGPSTRP